MSSKSIAADYVADLLHRIGQGEMPQKNAEISLKEFLKQILPHVKQFLAQGYTYKEIAKFLGQVSVTDLKKAVAKDNTESEIEKKASIRKSPAKKSATDLKKGKQ